MGIEPMSDVISPYGDGLELDHQGNVIRALMVNGVPWFALGDVCDALRRYEDLEGGVNHPAFPTFAKMKAGEIDSADDVTLLSPVGVWYLTTLMDNPGNGQSVAAWAKREAARLCPNPTNGDPAVFLTILDVDGRKELPPYPWKYSGRRAEFLDLRDSPEWIHRHHPRLLRPFGPPTATEPRSEYTVQMEAARRKEIGKPGEAIARQQVAEIPLKLEPRLPPYDQRPLGLKVPQAT